MTAQIIDGKAIAAQLRTKIKDEVAQLKTPPCLAVILAGDNPASRVYVKNKIKACADCGITSVQKTLPATVTQDQLMQVIRALNEDPSINGILLQLPLPGHLDSNPLIQMIAPEKDVDGLTHTNIGKLVSGDESGFVPCTPQGAQHLIHSAQEDLAGLHAVVIGRSLLFGKPMGQLLLQQNCTVTAAHSKTKDLPALCRQADIIIAAAGQPKMVQGDWVKDSAIVIDVGINRLEDGRLCGDTDFEILQDKVRAITPVPGGVGPMTVAYLLANTLKAYKKQKNLSS